MQNVQVIMTDPSKGSWFVDKPSVDFITDSGNNLYTININDKKKYQSMDGFGASLTDASCWLLKNKFSDAKRVELLKKLFSSDGINLSLLRQPIGASDFGWEAWSLDDSTVDDWNLSSFSLWREDAYIRPILDQSLSITPGRIKLFASPWSPPAWMKSKNHLFGGLGGYLRPECYDVYSDYFVKFVQEYRNKGTPIYAITPQNEPQYAPQNYPGMLMSEQDQIGFIRDYLGPKFQKAGINTKIVGFDHNYDIGGLIYARTVLSDPGANKYCDGIGFHTYTSPSHGNMDAIHNEFPSKDVWITEAGSGTWIGSDSDQFNDQMMHLIRSPRNWAKGVLFWNVALDQNSSPKLANVDTTATNRGLVTIRSDLLNSVRYETGYYSMGHSSKFVNPGAYRIDSNNFENDIENVAYLNTDKSIVLVVSNRTPNQRQIKVKHNSNSFTYTVPGLAAVTFKWTSDLVSSNIVAIKSKANNKYITVDNAGNLIASKDLIGNAEKFEINFITPTQISLKSLANQKYVCAENGGLLPLNANRDTVSQWEAFEIANQADGTIGLQSKANQKFICAENAGSSPLIANKDRVSGSWEAFEIVQL